MMTVRFVCWVNEDVTLSPSQPATLMIWRWTTSPTFVELNWTVLRGKKTYNMVASSKETCVLLLLLHNSSENASQHARKEATECVRQSHVALSPHWSWVRDVSTAHYDKANLSWACRTGRLMAIASKAATQNRVLTWGPQKALQTVKTFSSSLFPPFGAKFTHRWSTRLADETQRRL